MIKCNLWSNLPQNVLDLVKTSIFHAPLKSSLEWFAAAHKEVWVESEFDVISGTKFFKFSFSGLQNYKYFKIFCWIFLQCTQVDVFVKSFSLQTRKKRYSTSWIDVKSGLDSTCDLKCHKYSKIKPNQKNFVANYEKKREKKNNKKTAHATKRLLPTAISSL